jgi:hypothetical protein
MKKNGLFLFIILPLLLVSAGQASGSMSLYLVDDPIHATQDSMNVEIALSDLIQTDEFTADLLYSFDDTNYSSWSNLEGYELNDVQIIYFKLELFENGGFIGFDDTAKMSFLSLEDTYYGLDAYASVFLDWGEFQIQVLSSSSNDNFAAVPVPGAVWLLCTGLFGIVGTRRKVKK